MDLSCEWLLYLRYNLHTLSYSARASVCILAGNGGSILTPGREMDRLTIILSGRDIGKDEEG